MHQISITRKRGPPLDIAMDELDTSSDDEAGPSVRALKRARLLVEPEPADDYSPRVPGFVWTPLQERAKAAVADRKSFALFMDVGLGKTLVALWKILHTFGRLRAIGRSPWALVVSSKTVQTTWTRQVAQWYPDLAFVALRSSARERAGSISRALGLIRLGVPVVVSITYSQLSSNITEPFTGVRAPAIAIVDESSMRHLHAKKVARFDEIREPGTEFLMLTATPYQNGAKDLLSLVLLMDGPAFRELLPDSLRDVAPDKIVRACMRAIDAEPEGRVSCAIFDFLHGSCFVADGGVRPWGVDRFAIVVNDADECMDTKAILRRSSEITKEVKRLRGVIKNRKLLLRRYPYAEVYEYDLHVARAAVIAIDSERKALDERLRSSRETRFSTPVRTALERFLNVERVAGGRFVLFAHHLQTRADIIEYLESLVLTGSALVRNSGRPRLVVGKVVAEQGTAARAAVIAQFQGETEPESGPRPDVLVVGIQLMKEGVTLTAASQVLIVPETFNPVDAIQAEGRINRPGQLADRIAVYYLISTVGNTGRVFTITTIKQWLCRLVMDALARGNRKRFVRGMKATGLRCVRRIVGNGLASLVELDESASAKILARRVLPPSMVDATPGTTLERL